MTILQSLAGYYQRMADRGEAEPPGFSREKISYAVVIDPDGNVVAVEDLRDSSGKKPVATQRDVPASFKRPGVGVTPFFLWDKTSYSLGVAIEPDKRTPLQHEAFRQLHLDLLADATDEGLVALRRFLESWSPERFGEAPFRPDMRDLNFVFRLDRDVDDRGRPRMIHDRPAALPLIEARVGDGEEGLCLVSGSEGPIARIHPVTKGVDSSSPPPGGGHSLVSFNAPAYESWGREKGANAPTGQAAAARYGAALNGLLARNALTRMRIGDATVAFWADTGVSGEPGAQKIEAFMARLFAGGGKVDTDQDKAETEKVRQALEPLSKGRAVVLDGVPVDPDTRVHILGLSPNAARLSVRFWLTERLEDLARNLTRHEADCKVLPLPWRAPPSVDWLLRQVLVPDVIRAGGSLKSRDHLEKNQPLLAGDMARAVLGGTRYPRTLLSNAIMRLRAGDDPGTGWHAAVMRGVLVRDRRFRSPETAELLPGETPVSLKCDHPNIGYQLGRLFAVYELAQRAALGTKLNRTIRDSYFGSALSTPVTVFPTIIANGQHHLGKVRREKAGWAVLIERELEQINQQLEPREPSTIPKTLKLEDQAEFAIGYYHQRCAKLGRAEEVQLGFEDEIATPEEDAQ